ncbi:MAG: YaeQ family protein [Steroidobacteraceae bacterium]
MALGATVYNFTVRLADADRNVYETLSLRLARHPSETAEFLLTRLLAYCLEYTEGIAWSKGLAEPDEPAIAVRDLTGALHTWIDIGTPEAARLHKAAKAARRVVVYVHRDPESWLARLAGERIHRAGELEIITVDRPLLEAFVALLERRMDFDLAVADRTLYLTLGAQTLTGTVGLRRLGGLGA